MTTNTTTPGVIPTVVTQPALDLDQELVMGVTAASNDLVCWLWAAFPPKNGRLHITRIATGLGVSPTTIRRWIRDTGADQQTTNLAYPPLTEAGMKILRRRAILRGRGQYLWPPVDQSTLDRSTAHHHTALVARRTLLEFGPTPRDRDSYRDQPHQVHLVHYPAARVYGVSATYNDKSQTKIKQFGQILETLTVPDKHAAALLKESILARSLEHRCLAPRQMVPPGRTEVWRQAGGAPSRRILSRLRTIVLTDTYDQRP